MDSCPRKKDSEIGDVDHNMMGIESKRLYDFLCRVVEKGDLGVFEKTDARLVIEDLIAHMTVVIPERIFTISPERLVELQRMLRKLGTHLKLKFCEKGEYPFTIRRVCELCYDPLKYYKVNELSKFVNAMNSCCLVSTTWGSCMRKNDANRDENSSLTGVEQEDVSLTKISWMDEKKELALAPLITQIDDIMSVNFGFDDDEGIDEELEFGYTDHKEQHFDVGTCGGNIFDCDEEDDEEDGDYLENLEFDDKKEEQEEYEDDEEKQQEDEDEDAKQQEQKRIRHQGKSPKRRTRSQRETEILDGCEHDSTPPKKSRHEEDDFSDTGDRVTPFSKQIISPDSKIKGVESKNSESDNTEENKSIRAQT